MNTLVVLTDLGTFKAFRLEEQNLSSRPRLEPVDTLKIPEGDDRIGRMTSDQAGRFTKNAPGFIASHDQSNGERHNIWLENENRSVRKIAEELSKLLEDGQFDSCFFAAANEINQRIIEHLPASARAKIQKNLKCNLVNAQRDEILGHFNN